MVKDKQTFFPKIAMQGLLGVLVKRNKQMVKDKQTFSPKLQLLKFHEGRGLRWVITCCNYVYWNKNCKHLPHNCNPSSLMREEY